MGVLELVGDGFESGSVDLSGAHDCEESGTVSGGGDGVADGHPALALLLDELLVMKHDRRVELVMPHVLRGEDDEEDSGVDHLDGLPGGELDR